jgi:hypothetical protein
MDANTLAALPAITAITFATVVCIALRRMQFSVDAAHVSVVFFGITLRTIAISDIEFADKRWKWWNEHYNNTFNPRRIVRLRRRSGWLRNFIITPPDPDSFLRKLAMHGVIVR